MAQSSAQSAQGAQATPAITQAMQAASEALQRTFTPAVQKASEALKPAADLFKRVAFEASPLVRWMGQLANAVGTVVGAVNSFGQGVLAAASGLQQRLLGALGAVANASFALTAPFQRLAGSLSPFMDALNPALARELSYSVRELMATFGLLIQPIAQELAPLIREVAASLQPAFRALAPVLGEFARVIGRVVALLAQSFAQVLTAMQPALSALLNLFGQLVQALSPAIAAFASIFAAIGPALEALIKGLAPIFSSLAKAALYLTAGLLKLAGATGALDGMIKAVEGQNKRGPQSAGLQSAQNVQYTGTLEFGRSLALAATLAGPAGQEKPKDMTDLTTEILDNLKAIKSGDTWGPLLSKLEKWFGDVVQAVKDAGGRAVYSAAEGIGNTGVGTALGLNLNQRTWIDSAADWWYGNK